MIKRVLVLCAVLLGAAGLGCGGSSGGTGDLPVKPQIVTDRDSIVDQAIYAGQQKNQTLQVTDKGQQDLVVSGYTLSGDPGVVLLNSTLIQASDGSMNNTVKSNQTAFISMTCKPTNVGQTVTATLTINSNAENSPTKTVSVSCGPAVAPP
ncbi:MAG TPA: hypothetical protein VMH40_01525 [Myxococcaceae bacterium]|nr:hypothetical protein [Myxococcaceae bacterium]